MNWPFKKEDKSKEEKWAIRQEEPPKRSRFAYFRELPLYMKIFVVLAILFAFNVVLFLPLGLTAVLFEIWLAFIQALRMQLPLWIALAFMVLAAIKGIYLIPRVEIPSLQEKYFYREMGRERNLIYFITLDGIKRIAPEPWVEKIGWFRWVIIGDVEIITEDLNKRTIIYESRQREVSRDIETYKDLTNAQQKIARLERDWKRGKISLTVDDVILLVTSALKREERR